MSVLPFARTSAVFVGLANMFAYSMAGEGELGNAFVWNLDPWWPQNFLYALCAILAGLVLSEVVLKCTPQVLGGNFFSRHGLMVLVICLGGAMLNSLLTVQVLFDTPPMTMADRLPLLVSAFPVAVVAGGVLEAVEGVILAFPLACAIGMFRDRATSNHTENIS